MQIETRGDFMLAAGDTAASCDGQAASTAVKALAVPVAK